MGGDVFKFAFICFILQNVVQLLFYTFLTKFQSLPRLTLCAGGPFDSRLLNKTFFINIPSYLLVRPSKKMSFEDICRETIALHYLCQCIGQFVFIVCMIPHMCDSIAYMCPTLHDASA